MRLRLALLALCLVLAACGPSSDPKPRPQVPVSAVHHRASLATLQARCDRLAAAANADLEPGRTHIEGGRTCRWQSARHLLLFTVDEPEHAPETFAARKRLGFSRATSVLGRAAFFANQGQLIILDGPQLLFLSGPALGSDVETRVAAAMLR